MLKKNNNFIFSSGRLQRTTGTRSVGHQLYLTLTQAADDNLYFKIKNQTKSRNEKNVAK